MNIKIATELEIKLNVQNGEEIKAFQRLLKETDSLNQIVAHIFCDSPGIYRIILKGKPSSPPPEE